MASGLQEGERVFVPMSLLKTAGARPSAFFQTTVEEVVGHRVRVTVGANSELVASSKCQRNIGLLVITIGDVESELSLLDPLFKSVNQFCRLLASDSFVKFYKVRSLAELGVIWSREHAVYSHVVMIAHGNGSSLRFAVEGWQTAQQIGDVFNVPGVAPKIFVNLACEAGKAAFGQIFSRSRACDAFLGAFHSVHGAIASQFVQSFLVFHLLQGETTMVAFKHSRVRVPGSTSFRLWRKGRMTTGK